MHTLHTPIAVRAYPPRRAHKKWERPEVDGTLRLVFDTETRTDITQAFIFGSYRIYRGAKLLQEGLIAADDLPRHDVTVLEDYVRDHAADNGHPLRLWTRTEFVERVLWKIGYESHALIVGFNLGFDLSRLAVGWRPSRKGGFTLKLYESVDEQGNVHRHIWRPDVRVHSLGSKRQFIAFAPPEHIDERNRVDGHAFAGRFLDLHMAVFALTDRSLSLARAAELFGLPIEKGQPVVHGSVTTDYIDYNRQDVRVTNALYEAVTAEWELHDLAEPLEAMYSPATVGKAYLSKMGITPPRDRADSITDRELGLHMVAYYGGRTECRIRKTPVPVRYVDLTSQYPSVFVLLGLWPYVTAAQLVSADATEEARAYLGVIDREALFDQASWPPLATVICRVRPNGELLPARARYGSNPEEPSATAWTIGLNELVSHEDIWYPLADLVAAKLLGGHAPDILEARKVVPIDQLAGLAPVTVRGAISVDPAREDFFKRVIEERQRVKRLAPSPDGDRLEHTLKILANATAYGVFAEVRTLPGSKVGEDVTVHGLSELHCRVQTPEEAGLLCFAPFAATITGAGRLLLALLQAEVEALGGTYQGCDTDSLIVVASPVGGLVPCRGGTHTLPDGRDAVLALSDAQVDGILARFEELNPYDHHAVSGFVKLEDVNCARRDDGTVDRSRRIDLRGYQISSKRYALYQRTVDAISLRETKKHGFGMFRPPARPDSEDQSWIELAWERMVRRAEGFGLPTAPPEWNNVAVSQLAASSPHVLAPFRHLNAGQRYASQVKPYNFSLVAHVDPLATEESLRHSIPVAPYSTDPASFLRLPWWNRATGGSLPLTTKPQGERGCVRVRTYADTVASIERHPEHKSGDPAGGPALSHSVGLLPRVRVTATAVVHIGKESNRLDEEEAGAIEPEEDPYVEYRDPLAAWVELRERLRCAAATVGIAELARLSGIPMRTLRSNLNTARRPRTAALKALGAVADLLLAQNN